MRYCDKTRRTLTTGQRGGEMGSGSDGGKGGRSLLSGANRLASSSGAQASKTAGQLAGKLAQGEHCGVDGRYGKVMAVWEAERRLRKSAVLQVWSFDLSGAVRPAFGGCKWQCPQR